MGRGKKRLLEKLFSTAIEAFSLSHATCPQCGAVGESTAHSTYRRYLISIEGGKRIDSIVSIPRIQCTSCGKTHAILPDVLIPYGSYSLRFILVVLNQYLSRTVNVQTFCAYICGSVGCLKLTAPVIDGASKGKVERNFRTLKDRWLYALDIEQISSLKEFNDRLSSYIHQHNTTVHSATKESPFDRFLRTKDHIRAPKSAQWLTESFHNRVTRKVNNDSCISIDGVYYDAPQQSTNYKSCLGYSLDCHRRRELSFVRQSMYG